MTDEELIDLAEAMTDAVIQANAENREPQVPEGWSRGQITTFVVEMMIDSVPDDYQLALTRVQEARHIQDPVVGLTDEEREQIWEDMDSFLAQLSDGKFVHVLSSVSALDDIWCGSPGPIDNDDNVPREFECPG